MKKPSNKFNEGPILKTSLESKTEQEASVLSNKLQQNLFGAKE